MYLTQSPMLNTFCLHYIVIWWALDVSNLALKLSSLTASIVIMLYLSVVLVFIFLNIICDVNYFVRTIFTMLWGRILHSRCNLSDTTAVYGLGSYRDCDVTFTHVRPARLIRELDIARFHYYELTGIYRRSLDLDIHSLQGCTLSVVMEPVPLFTPYKITTKLVYWDDRSVFLEHQVVTLRDGKRRCFFLSRQHAVSANGLSTDALLKDLPGSEITLTCPQYIQEWLKSMEISSSKLRKI